MHYKRQACQDSEIKQGNVMVTAVLETYNVES